MKLIVHEYDLPLKHPFTISRSTTTAQRTLIVELQQDGVSGYGEAIVNSYYDSPMETMRSHLQAMQPLLDGETFRDTESFWNLCAGQLGDASFVLSALDCAAHDLWGRLEGVPVHRLWSLDPADAVVSSFTIGIAEMDKMVAKLAEMPGWPVYKIKLGTANDVEIIRTLREHTEAVFRVDANCSWAPDETAALADENCVGEADVLRCVDHFHGINIKLCKCGGLTPARRMIATARDHGLKVMVGCMTESSVGISAAAQLTPLIDYADLDGAVLLAKDAADGVQLRQGQFAFPDEPGLGIRALK